MRANLMTAERSSTGREDGAALWVTFLTKFNLAAQGEILSGRSSSDRAHIFFCFQRTTPDLEKSTGVEAAPVGERPKISKPWVFGGGSRLTLTPTAH